MSRTNPNDGASTTERVVDHHLKSFAQRDLEGILSDYAPGAVLFTPDGPLRGLGEIKPLFQAMITSFEKPGAKFELAQRTIDGEFAYILWTAETANDVYELGTDTFVVKGGKIVAQSFAVKFAPKS